MYSTVELDLALICASVPTLQTFVQRFMPRLLNLEARKESPIDAEANRKVNARPRRHRLISETIPTSCVTADLEMSTSSQADTAVDSPNTEFFGNKSNGSFITSHISELGKGAESNALRIDSFGSEDTLGDRGR